MRPQKSRAGAWHSDDAPGAPGDQVQRHAFTSRTRHAMEAALTRPHGLHQDDTVPADREAEAMLVLLDDDAALDKT